MSHITLYCLVAGEYPHENVFKIDVEDNKLVKGLKEVIKETQPNIFIGVNSRYIKLWKVNIPLESEKLKFFKIPDESIMDKLGSERMNQTTRIKEYFPIKPADRHISIIIETPNAIHRNLNQAYRLGCLSKGDQVVLKYKNETYTATFKEMHGRPYLIADGCEYSSFAKFIQAMIDKKSIEGAVYNYLKINSMSWKEFSEKLLFFNSVMQIKKELQLILNDPNVRDIFYGREEFEKSSTEVSIYEDQNLYVVVDRLPEERLKFVGEFPIVYISWGILNDCYPFNPPKIPFPLETLKKFDNILDTHLGLDFRSKYINLTAIALDWKVSGGVYEERPAIVFYVIRKGVIPLGDQHFPKIIDGIETDVREGIYRTTGTDSHYCRSYEPVITSGCSIGNSNKTSAGTLGCFAKDSTENTYILSCQHVLCLNEGSETGLIFQPAYIDYVGMLKSEKKITIEKINKAQYKYKNQEAIDLNSKKLETIENDLESAKKKDTLVGSFYKGLRDNYKIDDKNYGVDAAIASLVETSNGNFRNIDPEGLPISDFTFKRLSHEPINLSCTIDIINNLDSVDISQPVFKVGRTSGLTIGHINETILSSILLRGVHNAFHHQERIFGRCLLKEIKHKGKSIFPPKWLDRQITVMNNGIFTEEGDSGCIWFNKSGAVIAMGHGNLFTNIAIYSIGSPIHAVEKALNISIWFGE